MAILWHLSAEYGSGTLNQGLVLPRKYLKDTDGEIIEQHYNEDVEFTQLKMTVQGGFHELTELDDNGTEWIYTAVYGSTK